MLEQAQQFFATRWQNPPHWAWILGSGLGELIELLEEPLALPYAEIPGFPQTTVQDHAGCCVVGRVGTQTIVALQGRAHLYEGYSVDQVIFPLRVLLNWGVRRFVFVSAAGGIAPACSAGSLMLIQDQLNFTGQSLPLLPPDSPLSRPPASLYDAAWGADFMRVAAPLVTGTYAGVLGPSFSTPAELRAYRSLGADAIGMSTVLETQAVVQGGGRVLGLACITDEAIPEGLHPLTHNMVVAQAKQMAHRLRQDFLAFWTQEKKRRPST